MAVCFQKRGQAGWRGYWIGNRIERIRMWAYVLEFSACYPNETNDYWSFCKIATRAYKVC